MRKMALGDSVFFEYSKQRYKGPSALRNYVNVTLFNVGAYYKRKEKPAVRVDIEPYNKWRFMRTYTNRDPDYHLPGYRVHRIA